MAGRPEYRVFFYLMLSNGFSPVGHPCLMLVEIQQLEADFP